MTAKRPAILLLLNRDAVEDALDEADPAAADAVEEMHASMAAALSPLAMRAVWPLAALTKQQLEEAAAVFEVDFYLNDHRLFDSPKNPCRVVHIVASGSLTVEVRNRL